MTAPHANHPTPADLAAFAVGKLNDADARAVAEHLARCPDCRRAAENASGDSFLARLQAAGVPGPSDNTAFPGRPGPAAPPPNLPPELANHPRYRILRELGRGGMGVVYQARQNIMDRQVVIKVISKDLLDRPEAVERFRREVHAAAKLSHPNIVIAYDAEQAGDLHMLVMEFVPGQSLAEVLQKKGPLPVAQACHCVRQAALGLQHAHERGMVHRDVKPQNLMLTPKGQVKVLDFGLARLVSEREQGKGLTSTGAYMGTPDYSAPEQATDPRRADIRADLYSLGCTLYCLLAGRPPFREDTDVKTILAHLEKEPTPLPELRPDVPAALWEVVARLLAKDPGQRYQLPAEAAKALAPFVTAGNKAAPAGSSAAPSASAPAERETRTAGKTSPVRDLDKGALPRPVKQAPAAAEPSGTKKTGAAAPGLAPWWKRPPVLAAGGGAVLALALGALLLATVVFRREAQTADRGQTAERQGPGEPLPAVAQGTAQPGGPASAAGQGPAEPPVTAAPPGSPGAAPAEPKRPAPAAEAKPATGDSREPAIGPTPAGGTAADLRPAFPSTGNPSPAEAPVAQADPVQEKLDKARTACKDAMDKAQNTLLDQLKQREEGARKAGNKRLVDQVEAEREAFTQKNELPWSVPTVAYERGFKQEVAVMEAAYSAAIKDYTRAKQDARAQAVEDDLKRFQGDMKRKAVGKRPVVVATWAHRVVIKGRVTPWATHKLYSNHRIDSPDGAATWWSRGNALVLDWPNPAAPGGVWEDVCTLGADGKSYVGKNQNGTVVAGVRLANGDLDKKP